MFHCKPDALRRKALRDDTSLEDLLKYAKAIESSESQAKIIETERESDVYVVKQPGSIARGKVYLKKRHIERRSKYVINVENRGRIRKMGEYVLERLEKVTFVLIVGNTGRTMEDIQPALQEEKPF